MPLWKRDSKSQLKDLVREEEYRQIDSLADKDTKVLAQLASLLEDRDPQVRGKAATALAGAVLMHEEFYFQELEDIVIPRILKLLRDSDAHVRQEAALSVSNFPSRLYCGVSKSEPELIEQATPLLLQLLEDKDLRVQRSAGTSLIAAAYWLLENKRDVKAASDILSMLAEHRDERNREDVAYFWVKHANEFPVAAKKMIPILIKLTKDPNQEVRHHAERALRSLQD